MATQLSLRVRKDGTTVTVRSAPRGRFTLGVTRDAAPGRARVFLALSARHAAKLLHSFTNAKSVPLSSAA